MTTYETFTLAPGEHMFHIVGEGRVPDGWGQRPKNIDALTVIGSAGDYRGQMYLVDGRHFAASGMTVENVLVMLMDQLCKP